jgi:N-acetylmuramoyl-L-alanine amidase
MDHRLKISGKTSFIIIDEIVYHLPTSVKIEDDDLFLPAEPFFLILRRTIMPRIIYDARKELLDIDKVEFNITGLTIDEKANGTILRVHTREKFPEKNISSFVHDNGWFYLTITGGVVDSSEIIRSETRGVVRHVTVDQLNESVQLAFNLRSQIEGHEVYQGNNPSEIVITLRTPLSKSAERIKDVRDRWRLDTVVLDAGHGGKDGGTVGRKGTKEKDITLDIAKRVALMLEKNTKIRVVLTRDEDIFVPLEKRTQIANEANGKIFVSIHVNANPNRRVRGFESYLLRPGKTDDAIAVASRENAVIKLEDRPGNKFKGLTGESLIMATMAQSMFLKESEDLAAFIQSELDERLSSPNRGVKQAGFYVLIGASMPNVLIETGFLSNSVEEKNMKKPEYRQKIAQGIYSAILMFKESREKVLAEG